MEFKVLNSTWKSFQGLTFACQRDNTTCPLSKLGAKKVLLGGLLSPCFAHPQYHMGHGTSRKALISGSHPHLMEQTNPFPCLHAHLVPNLPNPQSTKTASPPGVVQKGVRRQQLDVQQAYHGVSSSEHRGRTNLWLCHYTEMRLPALRATYHRFLK